MAYLLFKLIPIPIYFVGCFLWLSVNSVNLNTPNYHSVSLLHKGYCDRERWQDDIIHAFKKRKGEKCKARYSRLQHIGN